MSEAPVAQGPLAGLHSATRAASADVDLDGFLKDLLVRAREIMGADTATVLLLEENGRTLVARAASGLEAEVYQGVRVPIGSGFAGRVAALGAPVVFSPTDGAPGAPAVPSPDAVRFVLGVPLTVDGRLLGVLHVGLRSQRRFTDDDIELLELVASTIATATQARMLSVERAAAQLLERSLMPAALPQCDGLDLAARYVPAERAVGGTGTTSLHCPPASCGW